MIPKKSEVFINWKFGDNFLFFDVISKSVIFGGKNLIITESN